MRTERGKARQARAISRLSQIKLKEALITALVIVMLYHIVDRFLKPLPDISLGMIFVYVVIIVIVFQLFAAKQKEKKNTGGKKEDYFEED